MRKWKSKLSPIISIIDHQPVPLSVLSTKGVFPALLIPATHWPTTRTKEPREKSDNPRKMCIKAKIGYFISFSKKYVCLHQHDFLQPYAKQYKQLRIQWKRWWELHFKCPTVKYEEHLIVLRVDKNAVKFSDVINFFFF